MSSISSRAVGAIVGGFIADAATLPVHWVYDQDALASAVSKHPTPEFLPEGVCPFYRLPLGKNSNYGDHLYVLLKSMVASNGFNEKEYTKGLIAMFGEGSAYDYERSGRPCTGPWLPGTMKSFLVNVANGTETGATGSRDCDCIDNTVAMVALYAEDPGLTTKVEEMVKVVQNTPICLRYSVAAAKLLEGFVLKGMNPNAVAELKGAVDSEMAEEIQKVMDVKGKTHNEACEILGYACYLPGNFLSMLHCLINAKPGTFTESIRPTLLAGGDNCSRAIFIGACLGAQLGAEALPADLLSKVDRGQEVKVLAERLVAMRK